MLKVIDDASPQCVATSEEPNPWNAEELWIFDIREIKCYKYS
jgi:hypothetical protein